MRRIAMAAVCILSGCTMPQRQVGHSVGCASFTGQSWRDATAPMPPYARATPYAPNGARLTPIFPVAASECGANGSATILLHVDADGRGGDFRLLDWQGSSAFGGAALAFVEEPNLRFHVVPRGSAVGGGWSTFHINYKIASGRT